MSTFAGSLIHRDSQRIGDLLVTELGKKSQFNDSRRQRILDSETIERFIECRQVAIRLGAGHFVQRPPRDRPSMLDPRHLWHIFD